MGAGKKKQGVKRTGKRNGENFAQEQRRIRDENWRAGSYVGEIMEQDFMLIALKRMGLLGEKRLLKLHETLAEVRKEFTKLCLEDEKDDKEIVYTKAIFDRELREVLGDRYFLEWDIRHDIENIRTIGIRSVEISLMLEEQAKAAAAEAAAREALLSKNGGCM